MGKKDRVEKQKIWGTTSLDPIMVNVKFVQKILLFASNRPRFPVLCATTCASWRETIIEFQTAELAWRNLVAQKETELVNQQQQQILEAAAAAVAMPQDRKKQRTDSTPNIPKLQNQLQTLFNQAACGGKPRTKARPLSSAPIMWVINQLLFLTVRNDSENGNKIISVSINGFVKVPDFDSFPIEDKKHYREPEEIEEEWTKNFSTSYSFAKDDDFLSKNNSDEESNENGNNNNDDDDDEEWCDTSPKFSFGTAPIFYVICGWGFFDLAKLLIDFSNTNSRNLSNTNFCSNSESCDNILLPFEACMTSQGRSVFNLLASRSFYGLRLMVLLLENAHVGLSKTLFEHAPNPDQHLAQYQLSTLQLLQIKLLNAKDRTGSFPLFEIVRIQSKTSTSLWSRFESLFREIEKLIQSHVPNTKRIDRETGNPIPIAPVNAFLDLDQQLPIRDPQRHGPDFSTCYGGVNNFTNLRYVTKNQHHENNAESTSEQMVLHSAPRLAGRIAGGMTLLMFCVAFGGRSVPFEKLAGQTKTKYPFETSTTSNSELKVVAKYLAEKGADVAKIRDAHGKTAMDYAIQEGGYVRDAFRALGYVK